MSAVARSKGIYTPEDVDNLINEYRNEQRNDKQTPILNEISGILKHKSSFDYKRVVEAEINKKYCK